MDRRDSTRFPSINLLPLSEVIRSVLPGMRYRCVFTRRTWAGADAVLRRSARINRGILMGNTLWSDAHYESRAKRRRATGKSAFAYDADIREGRQAARVHAQMDPSRLTNGVRESRDSDTHETSRAVSVLFDVTGSMSRVPRILQKSLPSLFGLCLRRGYLEDPAILVGGIGDATCDIAPLQVGQFESGNEIEDDLERIFLEGGGGGQQTESYELALYFLARKTSADCFEKRGERGYAFIIGDEMPYSKVKKREVEAVFGDHLSKDIPLEQILEEAQRKWEIYFVLPNMTHYYNDQRILDCWQSLLGQHVLRLEDPAAISELIASTIGLAQGAVDHDDLVSELQQAGTRQEIAQAVSGALQKGTGQRGRRAKKKTGWFSF